MGGGGGHWGGCGCQGGASVAMKHRILSYRTPPCHRRPVTADQCSAALQLIQCFASTHPVTQAISGQSGLEQGTVS